MGIRAGLGVGCTAGGKVGGRVEDGPRSWRRGTVRGAGRGPVRSLAGFFPIPRSVICKPTKVSKVSKVVCLVSSRTY